MYKVPNYYSSVSWRLSQVLDDIGVNSTTVNARRCTGMLMENMTTVIYKSVGQDISKYHFGSQTEGTTTLGLKSDTDELFYSNYVNVIQEWSEWKPDRLNLLMIQDDTTPPGYCRLQLLRGDCCVAWEDIVNKDCEYDFQRRVLLRNTSLHCFEAEVVRHGPANTIMYCNRDAVFGLPCKSWPKQATQWIIRCCLRRIPDFTFIGHSLKSGCFVVPTGHCSSLSERLEWRISTSMAERYKMFSMNITQIRCYVLLKMIVKTFILPVCPGTISSYHCKTILMYLVDISPKGFWNLETLLLCVTLCLSLLRSCIITNKCPHYFIPGNNLIEGRFDTITRERLASALDYIISTDVRVILGINIDNVGDRLRKKYIPFLSNNQFSNSEQLRVCIHSYLYVELLMVMLGVVIWFRQICPVEMFSTISNVKNLLKPLIAFYINGNDIERKATVLLTHSLCTTLGSLLASADLSRDHMVYEEALSFLSLGGDSDVASSRLKLVSTLFCAGEYETAEVLLRTVEERYDRRATEPMGVCNITKLMTIKLRTAVEITRSTDLKQLRSFFAFEVVFSRNEIHCVPKSLQYELFKCTEEERRSKADNVLGFLMDYAVVDSLPYLYYLQYLVYGRLGRQRDQQRALDNFDETCATEARLFHKETALNLIGQCMEEEGNLMDALACYRMSLIERPTHNVARWHIAILLQKMLK